MAIFKQLFHNQGLSNAIQETLGWHEMLVIKLTDQHFNEIISHPFIRQAKRHYRHRDGCILSQQQAEAILEKTRKMLGSELVETAILENLKILNHFPKLSMYKIEDILRHGYLDKVHKQADLEIKRAIEMSRCGLYHTNIDQSEYPNFKTLSFTDIFASSTIDYDLRFDNGNIIDQDSQIALIVYKTNLPIQYSYIFLRHFIRQRRRRFYEIISF